MEENKLIYLNSAAVALVSQESVDVAQKFQNGTVTNPAKTFFQWMSNDLVELRQKVAEMVHTDVSKVAFVPNFSFGIISIINSIRPKVKKVLLFKEDYPSLTMPFELAGFELFYVESKDDFSISIDEIVKIVDENQIDVVAISHVQFLTGFTIDIEELGKKLKQRGVTYIVDTTQSMGAVHIDFGSSYADVMITSSYKWLNGGLGSAILLVKDEFMEQFPPKIAGFGSMDKSPEGWSYTPSISSYEPGHLNPIGLLQLLEGVKHHLRMGMKEIQKHNYSLIEHLIQQLKDTSFKIKGEGKDLSTILVIEAPQEVHERLLENNIVTTWRKGGIRVSPHYYNTKEEIDELVRVLKSV